MDAPETLRQIACAVCKTEPDVVKAAKAIRHRIAKEGLMDGLIESMIAVAINEAVYDVRHAAKWQMKVNAPRGLDAISSTSRAVLGSILDTWPTPDGQWLGDCLGEQLRDFAIVERDTASGHLRSAVFYEALAKIVPAQKRVRDCVKPGKAIELLKNIDASRAARVA